MCFVDWRYVWGLVFGSPLYPPNGEVEAVEHFELIKLIKPFEQMPLITQRPLQETLLRRVLVSGFLILDS